MSRNSVILSSGDRVLGVAFRILPGSQASSRVEAKNSALLSNHDRYLLEPIEWPKWSQAYCGVLREDSGLPSRPCRKKRASSCDDRIISVFFFLAAACHLGFLSCYDGELRKPLMWRQGIAVFIRFAGANAALISSHSRGIEPQDTFKGESRGLSRVAAGPWVPSTCDCALRELLRVTMGSQEYCAVRRGLSGLHWVWCNGRGPHFLFKREPQGSSPILTWVSGHVCHFKQGIRYRCVWAHGTLLSSRVVRGVTGHQPS